MQTLHWLFLLSRPRFWMYLIGPFLVGIAASYEQLESSSDTRLVGLLIVAGLFFTLPANLLIYGINDVFDYETDKHNPKKKAYETLLEPQHRTVFYRYLLVFTLPFLVVMSLCSLRQGLDYALLALLAFLFFGVGYSMPPVRAKARPFFDSFFNILYIFPGVFAYAIIANAWPPIHILVAATLWTMAMHAYSAVPDIAADTKAGIATIATKLGRNNTIIFCALAYLLAGALTLSELGALSIIGSVVYTTMMVLSYRARSREELFTLYKAFPFINVVLGMALFWYSIIVF